MKWFTYYLSGHLLATTSRLASIARYARTAESLEGQPLVLSVAISCSRSNASRLVVRTCGTYALRHPNLASVTDWPQRLFRQKIRLHCHCEAHARFGYDAVFAWKVNDTDTVLFSPSSNTLMVYLAFYLILFIRCCNYFYYFIICYTGRCLSLFDSPIVVRGLS